MNHKNRGIIGKVWIKTKGPDVRPGPKGSERQTNRVAVKCLLLILYKLVNRGVFRAIVYYDSLDYPLANEELADFAFKDEGEVKAENLVQISDGFYFLRGRGALIKTRKDRNRIAEKKREKAMKTVWWLEFVPYVRLVFISGSLALRNTVKESDLDLLVAVKHGRIWTSRFLAVVLLGLLGLRRKRGQKVSPDKICLNHFITDKSLHIPRKSIYTAQLYARLMPILGDEKLVSEFCEANKWIGEYVVGWSESVKTPNSKLETLNKFKIQSSTPKTLGEKILNTKFGDWVEKILRKYQLHRIKNYPLTYKPGGRVKADDQSLEFHPDSPELKIIEKYNQTMIRLGFPELAKEQDSGLRT